MGLDASLAVERARSTSRVGRKRARSTDAAAAMDVDVALQPPPKRIHSSKSRSKWLCDPEHTGSVLQVLLILLFV